MLYTILNKILKTMARDTAYYSDNMCHDKIDTFMYKWNIHTYINIYTYIKCI